MAAKPAPVEVKQKLFERWKELEFVDDVEELKCCRCNKLSVIHFYTDCKHALCPNCKRLLAGGGFKCPQCDQIIQHIDEESTNFEEKLKDLRCKCPNSKYGCPLVTTAQQIPEHLKNCEWLEEKLLPAIYDGTNTNQLLIEEVSDLKKKVIDMEEKMLKLEEDLDRRKVAEENIKKNIEMSKADINLSLNGFKSDSQTLTDNIKSTLETLKDHIQTVNQNKLKDYEKSAKQHDKEISELNGKFDVIFKLVDQKEERLSRNLSEKVEIINAKLSESKDTINAIKNENHRILEKYELQQNKALEKCKKEISTLNKELQEKVEFSWLREELGSWQEAIVQIRKTVEASIKNENDKKQLIENLNTEFTQIINTNLGQMEEKIRQKFSKDIETLNAKIAESEKTIAKIKQQSEIRVKELKFANKNLIQEQTLVLEDFEKKVAVWKEEFKDEDELSDLKEKFIGDYNEKDNFQKTTERSIKEMKNQILDFTMKQQLNKDRTDENEQFKINLNQINSNLIQKESEIKECSCQLEKLNMAFNQLQQDIEANIKNFEDKIIIETTNVKKKLIRQQEIVDQNKTESNQLEGQQAALYQLQQQLNATSKELEEVKNQRRCTFLFC